MTHHANSLCRVRKACGKGVFEVGKIKDPKRPPTPYSLPEDFLKTVWMHRLARTAETSVVSVPERDQDRAVVVVDSS